MARRPPVPKLPLGSRKRDVVVRYPQRGYGAGYAPGNVIYQRAPVKMPTVVAATGPTTTQPRPVVKPAAKPLSIAQIVANYFKGIPTQAQSAAQARQSVQDQIDLALAQSRRSTMAEQEQLRNQATRAQGFALALGSLRNKDAEQAMGFYQQASDRLRNYGTGLTGALQEAQQGQAAQAQGQVSQMTAGLGQVGGTDPAAIRNALQYGGVLVPGTTMEEMAANAAVSARAGADISAQNVGQIAQQYLAKGSEAQRELDRQVQQLELTRPQLYRQALESARGGVRQDLSTLLSAMALQNTTAGTQAGITGLTPQGTPAVGYWFNPRTGRVEKVPANFHVVVNPRTGVESLAPLPGTKPAGPTTPSHVQASGQPEAGYYFPSADAKKKRAAQKIPTGYIFDPVHPFVPKPDPAGGGRGGTPTHVLANGAPEAGYYYPSAEAERKRTPQKIPTGYIFDPNNPYVPKRQPGTGGTKQNPTKDLGIAQKGVAQAIETPTYAVLANPAAVKFGAAPRWKPSLSYAEAKRRLLATYFPQYLRTNPRAIAMVEDALATVGYRRGR